MHVVRGSAADIIFEFSICDFLSGPIFFRVKKKFEKLFFKLSHYQNKGSQ